MMADSFDPEDSISADDLEAYLRHRHKTGYQKNISRDGLTVAYLRQFISITDKIVGWPHRYYLKLVLKNHFNKLAEQNIETTYVSDLYQRELLAIDVWTNLWPILQITLIYPGVYYLSLLLRSPNTYSSYLAVAFLCLYLISLYRYLDIMATLTKLHLSPSYIPHTSPRAIVGTLCQFSDIAITFASTYIVMHSGLSYQAFGGSTELLSSVVTPLYYSLVTMTTVGYGDIYPRAGLVQGAIVIQLFTGLYLLIVIFQHVISPRATRVSDDLPPSEKLEHTHIYSRQTNLYNSELYVAFLERFRHSEDFVKNIFKRFIDDFRGKTPVLDIGCARGEFLEVMKTAGIESYGIEINPGLVLVCEKKKLKVIEEDWKTHLLRLPDDSLGGIFSAQFAEHLDSYDLVELFQLSYHKLRADGCLVVETLTPCLNTMLKKFYVDFTHRVPLSPEALSFLASHIGFKSVSIEYYNEPSKDEALRFIPGGEVAAEIAETINQNFNKLNNLIYLPHYFCVIAIK